jgi:dTDP-4-dehydrorhamnose reductase
MNVVLFGSTGMLGSDFESLDLVRPKEKEVDILEKQQILDYFSNVRPSVVINCVGCCGGECEASPLKAHHLNVEGALNLAIASNVFHAKLIHFTSSTAGYGNLYTISKYYAEQILSRVCQNLCLVQVPWLFAKNNDKGFLSTVTKCLERNEPVHIYDNEVGTPTYAYDVAKYIMDNLDLMYGCVTVANQGSATRKEWANEIAEIKGFQEPQFIPMDRRIPINPVSWVKGDMRNWRDALRACICDKGSSLRS